MRKIHCLNAISKYGTDLLNDNYALTGEIQEADGILVRSASMHEMEFSDSLLAIACRSRCKQHSAGCLRRKGYRSV